MSQGLFRRLQQELGKTVVFVTHDIQEAFVLASRIGLMYGGELVVLATKDEFIQSQHPESIARNQRSAVILQESRNSLPASPIAALL